MSALDNLASDLSALIQQRTCVSRRNGTESRVRLEASHVMDADGRTCVIDASGNVGRDLNRLFVGFVRHEFGEDAFRVDRVPESIPKKERTACA